MQPHLIDRSARSIHLFRGMASLSFPPEGLRDIPSSILDPIRPDWCS
jgi:hypothetical protein